MYVCMYVCMYVMYVMYVCMYACMHVCICIYIQYSMYVINKRIGRRKWYNPSCKDGDKATSRRGTDKRGISAWVGDVVVVPGMTRVLGTMHSSSNS